jgi:DNA-binding MurR/RpiR family transcriptional regulator
VDYYLASYMAKSFTEIGISSRAFYPSMSETASVVSQMQEGDLLLALVGAGPSVDTGYALHLAKERGIKTVCLTGSGVALPAREAEITVIVPIKSPAKVASFGTGVLVYSLIWEALAAKKSEETAQNSQKRLENMTQLLKFRAETPEYEVASPHEIWKDQLPES